MHLILVIISLFAEPTSVINIFFFEYYFYKMIILFLYDVDNIVIMFVILMVEIF